VKSVDASGPESVASNTTQATIPQVQRSKTAKAPRKNCDAVIAEMQTGESDWTLTHR
jgi:hypothetical protein